MKALELWIERLILASRWILVIFYAGLGVALAVYGVAFVVRLYEMAAHVLTYNEEGMILAMLGLIDAALVASLVLMVMVSSYENFVGRFDEAATTELSWLGKLDSGSLKIKVASSIVAISSIHLLQVFLNATQYTNDKIILFMALHLTFVVSALLLAVVDRISSKTKDPKQP